MALPVAQLPSPRAAIYCRVSSDEQAERGHSLDGQEHDCRRMADDLGATVEGVYVDAGVSGARWDAPALTDLLEAARRRAFDMLICLDPDRLSRKLAKMLVVEDELRRAGVAIRYVNLRVEDNDEGRLMINIRGAFAEYERGKTRLRTLSGRREKARKGLVVGSTVPPFGYSFVRDVAGKVSTLDLDPATEPIARRIFEEATEYATQTVAERLNADGVRSPKGGRWTKATLVDMLHHPVYRGRYPYFRRDTVNGRRRAESDWLYAPVPAIVDDALFERVQQALTTRRIRRTLPDPASDPFTLRGLLACGHCGGGVATYRIGRYRYYACLRFFPSHARRQGTDTCELRLMPADALERHVWDLVTATLLDEAHLTRGLAAARERTADTDRRRLDRLDALDRETDRLRKRLQKLTVLLADADDHETEQAMRATCDETAGTIRKLQADRDELAEQATDAVTTADVDALTSFAADLHRYKDEISPQARRRVLELLRLQGAVRNDAGGTPLGPRHRFTFGWEAVITLADDLLAEDGRLTSTRSITSLTGPSSSSSWNDDARRGRSTGSEQPTTITGRSVSCGG